VSLAKKNSWLSYGTIAIGALCIGAAPIFAKLAVRDGTISPVAAGFWRMAIGASLFSLILTLTSLRKSHQAESAPLLDPKFVGMLLLAGVLFACDLAFWHTSFEYTSVANATLLANLSSLLVPLSGFWFRGEPAHRNVVTGLLLAFMGSILLVATGENLPGSSGSDHFYGDALALLTAFFYTGYILTTKYLTMRMRPLTMMTATSAVSSIILFGIIMSGDDAILPRSTEGWVWVFGLGLISQVCGQGLVALAIKSLPLSVSAVALLLAPASTALYAELFLDQHLTSGQWFGCLLTLFGFGVVALRKTSVR
jgi:drug/metabolite transporter (DMT)-like permease